MSLERAVEELERDMKEVMVKVSCLEVRIDEKEKHLKQTIDAAVNGVREQNKEQTKETHTKLDKIAENTKFLAVISDDPAEFLATWEYLKKKKQRDENDGNLIRKGLILSGVSAFLFALWSGVKLLLKS